MTRDSPKTLRLPNVTAYILVGILLGPVLAKLALYPAGAFPLPEAESAEEQSFSNAAEEGE